MLLIKHIKKELKVHLLKVPGKVAVASGSKIDEPEGMFSLMLLIISLLRESEIIK
jgi:hypothetical protein